MADKSDLMQGTLDMLVLRTLRGGTLHGYAIANKIQSQSDGCLQVEEGSLYPALHRMERRGWIQAEWGLSEISGFFRVWSRRWRRRRLGQPRFYD